MQLCLFDFDGTITTEDSLIKFIRFVVGDVKTLWGMIILSPMLITYKLKLIPNYKAKQWMLSCFFIQPLTRMATLERAISTAIHQVSLAADLNQK